MYYVRTFAGGKENWTGLKTELLSVARVRMKEHVDAAERERAQRRMASADGKMTFGGAMKIYRQRLAKTVVRPNTRDYREAGIDVRTVAEWLGHKDHGALLLKTYSHVRAEHEREMVAKVKFGIPAPHTATTPAAT